MQKWSQQWYNYKGLQAAGHPIDQTVVTSYMVNLQRQSWKGTHSSSSTVPFGLPRSHSNVLSHNVIKHVLRRGQRKYKWSVFWTRRKLGSILTNWTPWLRQWVEDNLSVSRILQCWQSFLARLATTKRFRPCNIRFILSSLPTSASQSCLIATCNKHPQIFICWASHMVRISSHVQGLFEIRPSTSNCSSHNLRAALQLHLSLGTWPFWVVTAIQIPWHPPCHSFGLCQKNGEGQGER